MMCIACGQESTDSDFCSECGVKIETSNSSPPTNDTMTCPDCTEIRQSDTIKYCENCGYDFINMKSYNAPPAEVFQEEIPIQESPIIIQPNADPIIPELTPTDSHMKWELHYKVDLSLRREGDPEPPKDQRDRTFPILFEDNLIGRRSDSKGIHPEIVIDDTGISRKHAIIKKHINGTLHIMDLGSLNGTEVNGQMIPVNIAVKLKNSDQIVMGNWSRFTVIGE